MKNFRMTLVVFVAVLGAGCAGGGTGWDGKVSGTVEVNDNDPTKDAKAYPPLAPLVSQSGTLKLVGERDQRRLELGDSTPVRGCSIDFYEGAAKRDSSGVKSGMSYRVKYETQVDLNGKIKTQGCKGPIDKSGNLVNVVVTGGEAEMGEDGEIVVALHYIRADDTGGRWVMLLKGKKSWF